MNQWVQELLALALLDEAASEQAVFRKIEATAHALGFEYCAYGRRGPLPLSKPAVRMINNYPASWQTHYARAGYLAVDPTVAHGRRSTQPLVWNDAIFAATPELWADARAAGLRVGWAQSSLDGYGVGGMLSLVRSKEPLGHSELAAKEAAMRWLTQVTHLTMSRVMGPAPQGHASVSLTPRETEILKWHADGKTAEEISDILLISVDTVKFHTRNAAQKLGAPNKTAAVVRAVMLGLLN
ncbi:transcriptional regulator RhlR [plant metagenome]|uniref:Transcriptional regulator RhlR n=1 Tax=plant metagenome TaxID=1297885 RepID=A0A484YRM7_9ZZZZ